MQRLTASLIFTWCRERTRFGNRERSTEWRANLAAHTASLAFSAELLLLLLCRSRLTIGACPVDLPVSGMITQHSARETGELGEGS